LNNFLRCKSFSFGFSYYTSYMFIFSITSCLSNFFKKIIWRYNSTLFLQLIIYRL